MNILEGKITVNEAVALTGHPAEYIRQLCRAGRIEFIKVGSSLMVDKQSILDYKARMDAKREERKMKRGKDG